MRKILIACFISSLLAFGTVSVCYSKYVITKITNDNAWGNYYPKIKDSGYIVWWGNNLSTQDPDVFLYNGVDTINLSELPGYSDIREKYPEINNNGQVVWIADNDNYVGQGVFLYDGTNIKDLTTIDPGYTGYD